jgi:hypothetical protein
MLVKEGEGTLDLTGAVLANAGLDIRSGTVRFAAGASSTVTTRFLRFAVRETRPGKKGPPEYGGSGSQFSEFRLYRGGKMLPMPQGAKAMNGKYPKLAEALRNRSDMYNAEVAFCEKLEAEGKAVILRPDADKMIDSMESDTDKLAAFYHHGYDVAAARMNEIKEMF